MCIRDRALAESAGTRIHIAHVSTAGAAAFIRAAKARGVRATCETAPHYFLLTHELLRSRDADYRMNPPLREPADLEAMKEAILDGTIDCNVTDHAPHTAAEKTDFEKAPNGVVGLETSFAASYTGLVKTGLISLGRLVELMSVNPARILGVPGGHIRPGDPADLVLMDLGRTWTVDCLLYTSILLMGFSITGIRSSRMHPARAVKNPERVCRRRSSSGEAAGSAEQNNTGMEV